MLHYETRKRHSKIIAKTFLAHLQREGFTVVAVLCSLHAVLIIVDLREGISRIQDSEKEFVTFLAILSEECTEILH